VVGPPTPGLTRQDVPCTAEQASAGRCGSRRRATTGQQWIRNPQGVYIHDEPTDTQKILALSWSDNGTEPVVAMRMGDGTVGAGGRRR
jgi:hypothetical protein